jgi:hypothetical protein
MRPLRHAGAAASGLKRMPAAWTYVLLLLSPLCPRPSGRGLVAIPTIGTPLGNKNAPRFRRAFRQFLEGQELTSSPTPTSDYLPQHLVWLVCWRIICCR